MPAKLASRTSLFKKILLVVLLIILTPYALSMLYLHIRPPSTIMLARWLTLQKVERIWVPLSEMAPTVKMAVVLSEDDAFCDHWGFDFKQLERSLSKAKSRSKTIKATSTISQQLVKNLFLWPGRSWLRKTLEIPLTIWIEMTWTKEQILETYLNVAEWGPGIFGVEMASQYHFHTSAKHLTMLQSSLLATALPNPIQRSASSPGPAQTLLARHVVLRLLSNAPDLSCVN